MSRMHLEEKPRWSLNSLQDNIMSCLNIRKAIPPLIILQSAKKFKGEKTGTKLSYVPKICPSYHLENQVKFSIHTCFL